MNLKELIAPVRDIAFEAGTDILDIYRQPFEIHEKTDGSPVTTADNRAHDIICRRLLELTPDIPILSEESSQTAFSKRRDWRRFWLVDPLDGTKEFIKKNGEFTVNIALVEEHTATLGIVYTPAQGVIHQAASGYGAQRLEGDTIENIRCRPFNRKSVCLVASRSHAGAAVDQYRAALTQDVDKIETASMGSALKICLVAEGKADIYPRLGLTSEWDTGASHCVLSEAGGRMTDLAGHDLTYNTRDSVLNPWFLATGDPSHDWFQYLADVEMPTD